MRLQQRGVDFWQGTTPRRAGQHTAGHSSQQRTSTQVGVDASSDGREQPGHIAVQLHPSLSTRLERSCNRLLYNNMKGWLQPAVMHGQPQTHTRGGRRAPNTPGCTHAVQLGWGYASQCSCVSRRSSTAVQVPPLTTHKACPKPPSTHILHSITSWHGLAPACLPAY